MDKGLFKYFIQRFSRFQTHSRFANIVSLFFLMVTISYYLCIFFFLKDQQISTKSHLWLQIINNEKNMRFSLLLGRAIKKSQTFNLFYIEIYLCSMLLEYYFYDISSVILTPNQLNQSDTFLQPNKSKLQLFRILYSLLTHHDERSHPIPTGRFLQSPSGSDFSHIVNSTQPVHPSNRNATFGTQAKLTDLSEKQQKQQQQQ